VKDRDASGAREAMRRHLDNAERNWHFALNELKQPGTKSAGKSAKPRRRDRAAR